MIPGAIILIILGLIMIAAGHAFYTNEDQD